ncbi:hypothetical protein ACWIID_07740 [Streptomyces phaeochromogenes]
MKSDAGLQQLFEWALRHAILSSYVRGVHPERDLHLRPPTYP